MRVRVFQDMTLVNGYFLTFQKVVLPLGRDSSVGIATRYGLDGSGIKSRWGRDFPRPSRPALGPTQPLVQWVPGLSWGGGVDHSPHLAPRLKEEYIYTSTPLGLRGLLQVDLYLYL